MKSAPLPVNELERRRALASYGVVEATQDEAFAALVRVASIVCEAPIAMVSLVEERRQWFMTSVGIDGMTETPREVAFCAHAIHSRDIMVVEDAASDERFADNPLVLEAPHIRFYAGCPLIDKEGFALGTMCVIDRKPRTLSPTQASVLRELSTAVVRLLEAKRIDNALYAAEAKAKRARAELAVVLDAASSSVAYWDADLKNRFANQTFLRFFGLPVEASPSPTTSSPRCTARSRVSPRKGAAPRFASSCPWPRPPPRRRRTGRGPSATRTSAASRAASRFAR